ncbi:MAG TPA: hypothetical protein VMT35_03790 [Ignavibacteriaceae bacterium]|nr:hypothetical protein [Ignavibacteriaceae bacterium]
MNADYSNPLRDDLSCVWMTSGLVSYKLCSLQFDCDNCEFDKAFRNDLKLIPEKNSAEKVNESNPADVLLTKIKSEHFDEKLIYLNNQLVMKKIFGNAYYLGINPVILLMINNVNLIGITNENNIKKGQAILNIEGSWGKKEFISPLDFLMIEKFSLMPAAINLNKWFAILISDETIESQYNFARWNEEKDRFIQNFKMSLNAHPEIGKTLMDGGEKLKSIDRILGKKEYLELINGVFI